MAHIECLSMHSHIWGDRAMKIEERPRPKGYNYKKPDPCYLRCIKCNSDGMNRTGLVPVAYIGASTTSVIGIQCVCDNGLKLKHRKIT